MCIIHRANTKRLRRCINRRWPFTGPCWATSILKRPGARITWPCCIKHREDTKLPCRFSSKHWLSGRANLALSIPGLKRHSKTTRKPCEHWTRGRHNEEKFFRAFTLPLHHNAYVWCSARGNCAQCSNETPGPRAIVG